MMAKPKMKLWIGILLYGAAIILQLFIMKMLELSTLAKVFIALLPMLPAIWLTKNILLAISKYDELKKENYLRIRGLIFGSDNFNHFVLGVFRRVCWPR
ncbi:MAG TPA: hypothetical protein ENK21_07580 [Trueperaceae bacterium]|nr:hypothetical protein [Trueperaceae bacterium]